MDRPHRRAWHRRADPRRDPRAALPAGEDEHRRRLCALASQPRWQLVELAERGRGRRAAGLLLHRPRALQARRDRAPVGHRPPGDPRPEGRRGPVPQRPRVRLQGHRAARPRARHRQDQGRPARHLQRRHPDPRRQRPRPVPVPADLPGRLLRQRAQLLAQLRRRDLPRPRVRGEGRARRRGAAGLRRHPRGRGPRALPPRRRDGQRQGHLHPAAQRHIVSSARLGERGL